MYNKFCYCIRQYFNGTIIFQKQLASYNSPFIGRADTIAQQCTYNKFIISAIYIKSMMIMSCEDNNDDADGINSDNR